VLADLFASEQVLALPCGERSLRFRPALTVTADEIDEAVAALGRSVSRLAPADPARQPPDPPSAVVGFPRAAAAAVRRRRIGSTA
jgi:hypothetical protein